MGRGTFLGLSLDPLSARVLSRTRPVVAPRGALRCVVIVVSGRCFAVLCSG